MSSLRNGAVSALAFAGGSLIAALYTHYQNKASPDNDSQDEEEEIEDNSRKARKSVRKSRRTKSKVEFRDCSDSDVPSTPNRRIDPRSKERRTHKRPRKALKAPSSPFDAMKQKPGVTKQIGQFTEAKGRRSVSSSRNRSPAMNAFLRGQSPLSMRSNCSSTGTSMCSMSMGSEFGDIGPASPSFGPEERMLSMCAKDDAKEQAQERENEKEMERMKHFKVEDSPMIPKELFSKKRLPTQKALPPALLAAPLQQALAAPTDDEKEQ